MTNHQYPIWVQASKWNHKQNSQSYLWVLAHVAGIGPIIGEGFDTIIDLRSFFLKF